VARSTAEAHRCAADYNLLINGPAVVNDPAMVRVVRVAAAKIVGPDRIADMELLTGSEDFREYSSRFPAALFFMGMRDESRGIGQAQHDPAFRVNDDVLADAAAVMAAVAVRFLERKKSEPV
jgi:amidohydrolase